MNVAKIQEKITEYGLDGWLFYDFRGKDSIAQKMLNLDPNKLASRRWFYFIPASGDPRKLANAIEPHSLDHLPGTKSIYMPWKKLPQDLKELLGDSKKIAMQYSPNNNIPYLSNVDAGTIELIRSLGFEIVSSGNLVSEFEAHLDEEAIKSHYVAGDAMHKVLDEVWKEVASRIRSGNNPTEYDIYLFMHERYKHYGLWTDHGPIVAVNEHAADPHFEPSADNCSIIKEGDLLLVDTFCKMETANAVWYDITWMSYVGTEVPERITEVFNIARDARDTALNYVKERFANGLECRGCDVDDASRNVIENAGLGQYFIHRTGHNISQILHGNGAHCDNFETKDERLIIKGSCFSIEPGIYIPEEKIGFRTEIDVIIDDNGNVDVCGPIQDKIVLVMNY